MHELALMDDLVSLLSGELKASRVHIVRLEVGRQAGVVPEALHFCFDVCVAGTALEGAALDIVSTNGAGLKLKEVEVS